MKYILGIVNRTTRWEPYVFFLICIKILFYQAHVVFFSLGVQSLPMAFHKPCGSVEAIAAWCWDEKHQSLGSSVHKAVGSWVKKAGNHRMTSATPLSCSACTWAIAGIRLYPLLLYVTLKVPNSALWVLWMARYEQCCI